MQKEFKAHPLMILSIIRPFMFILLIPVLRGTVQYIKNGEIEHVLGTEMLIFAAIVLFAVARWRLFRLTCDEGSVSVRDGVFIVRKAVIHISGLSSVQTEQNPLDYIFGCVTFRINTEAGSRTKTDYSFKLRRSSANEVARLLYGEKEGEPVRFSPIKIAILAAATSSAFTGLLVGVPILNSAARLTGRGVNEVLDEISTVSNKFQTYFPPIVNTVTFILLCSFAVSFIYSFFRHFRFRIYLNDDRVEVRSGLIATLRTSFKKSSVNNVKIEQTILMKLLKRYSMKVNVGGFGEAKSESQVLVPCGKNGEIKEMFSDYFPFLQPDGKILKSKEGATHLNRYFFWAEIFMLILVTLAVILGLRFDAFGRLIAFVTCILGFLLLYYTYLCYNEYRYCKVRFGKTVYARGKKGLRKSRFYCPKDRVAEIRLYEYPLDPFYKTCNIRIITRSETADNLLVRHVDFEDTKNEIFKSFGITE